MIKKPSEVLKDLSFELKNVVEINNQYLESLFEAQYHGRGHTSINLNKESIEWINKELNILFELQESNRLNPLIDGQGSTQTIDRLYLKLGILENTLQNIRASFIESGKYEVNDYYYRDKFNAVDLSKIKHQILTDLVQTLVSVNTIAHEENVSAIDALGVIRYITENMLWLIDEGYHSLFLGKLTEEEIKDVLVRKYDCRMFEKSYPMMGLYVNIWYRTFAKKDKNCDAER
ncbi:hypothetical protein [Neobacillus sp. OS1-33]|uniref:hypothetical protein n=1 Tax=Neobacillus sp. OS1-33 TaxID=3070683 RepID=UPI0027E17ABE|nr:hypothetical protein [Neobacillus sp. OS1-33]WML26291.1 hypothetical protein RCG22_01195 [Neobacillus sp. OS1-33]